MDVEISYLAVALATLAAMVVGGIYFSPLVVGKQWATLVGIDEAKAKKDAPRSMIIMLVGAFIKAYLLATLIYAVHSFYGHSRIHDALGTAFSIWLGFLAVHITSRNLFEQKPFKLTLIHLGNELVILLAMAAVIGSIHP